MVERQDASRGAGRRLRLRRLLHGGRDWPRSSPARGRRSPSSRRTAPSPVLLRHTRGARINRMLHELDIELVAEHLVTGVEPGSITGPCLRPGKTVEWAADGIVLVTQRLSDDALYRELKSDRASLAQEGITGLYRIGDALCRGSLPTPSSRVTGWHARSTPTIPQCRCPSSARPRAREDGRGVRRDGAAQRLGLRPDLAAHKPLDRSQLALDARERR